MDGKSKCSVPVPSCPHQDGSPMFASHLFSSLSGNSAGNTAPWDVLSKAGLPLSQSPE